MDTGLLSSVVKELEEALTGALVSKIHQPSERDLVLRLYARGREWHLLISAHHSHPRIHLITEDFTNPPVPPRFCAFLRSRIDGALVEGFAAPPGERVVEIRLKKGFDGRAELFTIIAELTGKSSNIILVDSKGVVLDALKYFKPDESIRPVAPGLRLDPLPPRAALPGEEGAAHEELRPEEGRSWNEAAERRYAELISKERFTTWRSALKRVLSDALRRAARKVENLRGDGEKAARDIDLYKSGELLMANLAKAKKGAPSVEVEDYSEYPSVKRVIKLDEKLSARENAERFFKRARKAKAAVKMLEERLPAAEADAEFLSGLLFDFEEAEGEDDLKTIEDELVEAGFLKGPLVGGAVEPQGAGGRASAKAGARGGGKKAEGDDQFRRAKSTEGFEIIVGKSAKANDRIVRELMREGDVWLHAHGVPGSHVLIKTAGRRDMSIETVHEAAALAAFHSKAKGATAVEVVYTDAANVKKPRGAKAGMVTVGEFKTVKVRPKG